MLRLTGESGWLVVGQFLAVAASFALVRTLTEMLSPVQYGQVALGLTVAMIVNQVVTGGLIAGVSRYYSIAKSHKSLREYFRATALLLLLAVLVITMTALVLSVALSKAGFSEWTGLAVAALGLSIFQGVNAALNGIQNAARHRAIVAFHLGVEGWLKIAVTVGAIAYVGPSATVVVVAYTLSAALISCSQVVVLRRFIAREESDATPSKKKWAAEIWTYSWPFTAWGGFTWLQQASDRWSLQMFGTAGDVGYYAVLFQIGYAPIALVTGLTISFVGPVIFQRAGSGENPSAGEIVHGITWKLTGFALGMTFLVALSAWLFHRAIFTLMVAQEYRGASHLLPWAVMAGGMFAAGQVLSLKLMSALESTGMIAVKIGTAILGFLLNVGGGAVAGIDGVVAAQVTFSLVYLAWMSALTWRGTSATKSPSADPNSSGSWGTSMNAARVGQRSAIPPP